MQLTIDFTNINSLDEMHNQLKDSFGFPDFYGNNGNALIDCLTSLRYPQDGMLEVTIGIDEVLELEIKNFPLHNEVIVDTFFRSIKAVNKRYISKGNMPVIHLILV
ncbi:barstar family protein [Phocoenobacter skyensis]|uniref:Barstar (Barnase inhibitor) n=1 Tax=Phocoenobacter skyensis TaxID=97481 RepID=A0A1H7YRL8_9PAST|nr:barstar family protein [Pasteurella skyensis]MDP8079977.1 barstar family protein [Pasteurella skyensis]MDP8086003.1 barstar family protein [Pasteurella skyensis]MDP8185531.1 barstar family protein [Pasteurella skyensis]QLB22414.1 hypothetical protein A6B44_04025 [Pasteurella skyensis]SEM48494.1 Barstar (barnase inhibitor) [Pasteurella skyensis]